MEQRELIQYPTPYRVGENETQCAKRSTDSRARDLTAFPTGKALLDAEDLGDSATDPEYWWMRLNMISFRRSFRGGGTYTSRRRRDSY